VRTLSYDDRREAERDTGMASASTQGTELGQDRRHGVSLREAGGRRFDDEGGMVGGVAGRTAGRPAPVEEPVGGTATTSRPDRAVALVLTAAVASAALVLAAASWWGGATAPAVVGDPGPVTRWGLVTARTVYDVAAMGTLGVLAVAVLLLPASAGQLLPDAQRLVRLASRWAVGWAAAAAVGAFFTLSNATGRPVWEVVTPDVLALSLNLEQTRALWSSAWLAVLVVAWSRWTATTAGGWLVLLTASAALLPTLLSGHSGHGEAQAASVTGLALHVGAASLWVGGLLALALHLRRAPAALASALPGYSRMALACVVVLAASGAFTGWASLDRTSQLWTTPYGQLLLCKAAALAVLGGLGYLHRRRTIAAVADRRPRSFLVLAAVEIVLMAGTAALAVGLSRTPPPDAMAEHGAAAMVQPVVAAQR
jgi:putative copper resistance protein D